MAVNAGVPRGVNNLQSHSESTEDELLMPSARESEPAHTDMPERSKSNGGRKGPSGLSYCRKRLLRDGATLEDQGILAKKQKLSEQDSATKKEIEPAKEKRLHKSHLMIISKILMQIATKWRFIGLALKFKDHELRNIQETPSTFRGGPPECLQIMLRKWLQRRSPKHDPPTQSALVGALGASTVGGDHLVKEIEEIQWSDHDFIVTPILEIYKNGDPSIDDVQNAITSLKGWFKYIKQEVSEQLESACVNIKDLCDVVTDLPPHIKGQHEDFIMKYASKFDECKCISMLFIQLNSKWDYLHFDILEHIIIEYRSSMEEVRKIYLGAYQKEIQDFMQYTTLKKFCTVEKMSQHYIEPPPYFVIAVTKHSWEEPTYLYQVDNFRKTFAHRYNLHDCAVSLVCLGLGSVVITMFVPESIRKILEYESGVEEFCAEHSIFHFEVGDVSIYGQDESKVNIKADASSKQAELTVRDKISRNAEDTHSQSGNFELFKVPQIQAECPICLQILRNPYQVVCCGINLCYNCIMQLPIEEHKCKCPKCEDKEINCFVCPICKKVICENCMKRNIGLQNSLKQCEVKCLQGACNWIGYLGNYNEHEDLECLFVENPKHTEERSSIVPVKRTVQRVSSMRKNKQEYFSEPFYTHKGGYKMRLWVFPNGYGNEEGKYVSVFTCLVRGENDDHLRWPLRGSITIQLLDQSDGANHMENTIRYTDHDDVTYSGRVTHSNRSEGIQIEKFISHDTLFQSDCVYLKNDCLKFRISRCKIKQTWNVEMILAIFIVLVSIFIIIFNASVI